MIVYNCIVNRVVIMFLVYNDHIPHFETPVLDECFKVHCRVWYSDQPKCSNKI